MKAGVELRCVAEGRIDDNLQSADFASSWTSMSEASISFSNHDEIRTLFGPRDQHLRRVRESVGVDVVIRDDEICLLGTDEQIERALDIFSELRDIIAAKGHLRDSEVDQALIRDSARHPAAVETVVRLAAPPDNGDRPGTAKLPASAGPPIELFEKAKKVIPRTPGQAEYVRAIRDHDLVFCAGPAGCGKTFLAVAMAINALRTERVKKIVLVRPAVEAGERLGFLPGDMLAKVNPYLRPLLDALNDHVGYEQAKRYMDNDIIEVVPLAFMRGRTLNQTFMILDEAQNTTVTQMKMFLTRMGIESKIVVTGDATQADLPADVTSGLADAIQRLGEVEGVATVSLAAQDIVRHRLVQDVVRAYETELRSTGE
jgi:phosphate starvation-inducible PhoH-like protein